MSHPRRATLVAMANQIVDRTYCHYRQAEEAVMAWVSAAGYDPDEVRHVLVDEDDPPRVWIYDRDKNGRHYLDESTGEPAGHYADVPGDTPPIPVALPWAT